MDDRRFDALTRALWQRAARAAGSSKRSSASAVWRRLARSCMTPMRRAGATPVRRRLDSRLPNRPRRRPSHPRHRQPGRLCRPVPVARLPAAPTVAAPADTPSADPPAARMDRPNVATGRVAPEAASGKTLCCPPGYRGCDDGVCYPGGCCTAADCGLLCEVCGADHICYACEDVGQTCQNGTCVPPTTPSSTPTSVSSSTPTNTNIPTDTPTSTSSPTPTTTPTTTPCGTSGVAACTANDQCCSGICQAGLCVATTAGICPSGFDLCSGEISNVPCGGSCLCGTLSNGSILCFAAGACYDDCEECGGTTCDPNMPCCAAGCFEPCTPDGTPG